MIGLESTKVMLCSTRCGASAMKLGGPTEGGVPSINLGVRSANYAGGDQSWDGFGVQKASRNGGEGS